MEESEASIENMEESEVSIENMEENEVSIENMEESKRNRRSKRSLIQEDSGQISRNLDKVLPLKLEDQTQKNLFVIQENLNRVPNPLKSEDQTQNNSFVSLIQENLDRLPGLSKLKHSIYRVPERLRSSKEEAKAYTPKVVSIGPIHYGTNKDVLSKMEDYKLFFFNEFLKRTSHSLTYYDEIMKEKEVKLRSFYSETLQHLNSENFLKIILIDATFIIEFLLRYSQYGSASTPFDYIFNSSISTWLLPDLKFDLLLLENQIPFFVLDDLYDLIKEKNISFKTLVHCFWKPTLWGIENIKLEDINNIQHLLDFVWKSYISVATPQQKNLISKADEQNNLILEVHDHGNLSKHQENEKENFENIPSIIQLHDCGVVFMEKKKKNLFDITFEEKKGILYMPKLRIDDSTDVIFRNLIAYEQCNCEEKLLSNYLKFVDNLVDTPDDVHLLVKRGIFENLLGDDNDVASLINKLCAGVIINDVSYFTKVGAQLNTYYRSSWHKAKANLKQKYFNTPWAIIAFIASTFLLVITVLQTVYTIIQSYQ